MFYPQKLRCAMSMNAATDRKPSIFLRSVLTQLLNHAEDNPGQIVSTRLTNNLKVELTVQRGQVHLGISRSSAWPSEADWRMVLRHWPYPVEAIPQAVACEGRCYLEADLPLYES